jgi:hypothetical protein
VNAVIDAKTAHPKMKLKQLMMIDVGDGFAES